MEYYLELKGKELSSHEKTWKTLKCIFSDKSQLEKAPYYRIPTLSHSGKGKPWRQQKIGGLWGLRGGRDEQAEHKGCLGLGDYSA